MDLFKVIDAPDPKIEPYPGAYQDRLVQLAYEAGWFSPRKKQKHISGLVVCSLVPQMHEWFNP